MSDEKCRERDLQGRNKAAREQASQEQPPEDEVEGLLCDIVTEKRGIPLDVLQEVILLAVEIAREGREGRKIGTMFLISDTQAVMDRSRCLILDPLAGHPDAVKNIANHNMQETIKELAQLDGAFIIADDGTAMSATRFVNATTEGINLPLGLGSRHMAAASITRETETIAVVVSESSVVRIFDDGEIISEILPELWLLRRHGVHITGPMTTRMSQNMTVVSKREEKGSRHDRS